MCRFSNVLFCVKYRGISPIPMPEPAGASAVCRGVLRAPVQCQLVFHVNLNPRYPMYIVVVVAGVPVGARAGTQHALVTKVNALPTTNPITWDWCFLSWSTLLRLYIYPGLGLSYSDGGLPWHQSRAPVKSPHGRRRGTY